MFQTKYFCNVSFLGLLLMTSSRWFTCGSRIFNKKMKKCSLGRIHLNENRFATVVSFLIKDKILSAQKR